MILLLSPFENFFAKFCFSAKKRNKGKFSIGFYISGQNSFRRIETEGKANNIILEKLLNVNQILFKVTNTFCLQSKCSKNHPSNIHRRTYLKSATHHLAGRRPILIKDLDQI